MACCCSFQLLPFLSDETGHAASPNTPEPGVSGDIALVRHSVEITFRVAHAVEAIRFDFGGERAQRRDGLWRSTCFELFLKCPSGAEYWEYNLAPGGDWNAYRFTGYRAGMREEQQIRHIPVEATPGPGSAAVLRSQVPLPKALYGQALQVGICCVIETILGDLRYFALHHPGDRPDFHDPAGFCLNLGPG